MNTETVVLIAESDAPRADIYLASSLDASRSQIQKWVQNGGLTINGKIAKSNTAVKKGDILNLQIPEEEQQEVKPQNIPLDIVYEDDSICVINKPKGMVVHPGPGNQDGTLVNALLFHFDQLSGIGGADRPGIVHRIDKDTSGLLVVAKNDRAHEKLAAQFADHSAHRSYVCLVHGNMRDEYGTIDAPIGRHPVDRKRMTVIASGRKAVTHWQVLRRFGDTTLLRVNLETGRTHQIRVHMAYIKHPILGDPVYGSPAPKLGLYSQALHGYKLCFIHPETGIRTEFIVPVTEDFKVALERLSPSGKAECVVEGVNLIEE